MSRNVNGVRAAVEQGMALNGSAMGSELALRTQVEQTAEAADLIVDKLNGLLDGVYGTNAALGQLATGLLGVTERGTEARLRFTSAFVGSTSSAAPMIQQALGRAEGHEQEVGENFQRMADTLAGIAGSLRGLIDVLTPNDAGEGGVFSIAISQAHEELNNAADARQLANLEAQAFLENI